MSRTGKVVPARLNFLAIYSPPLGSTEATEQEQIAFFWARDKSRVKDVNYQLRQVGLAQGIVTFASTFSTSQSVDSVETEKQRIVLTQLETSWWVLAAIDLTRIPTAKTQPQPTSGDSPETLTTEYSSREVSPPVLLLQQLRRAHRVFLLHHGCSLSDLYVRSTRGKFCGLLDAYWTQFSRTWEVLLHGNPAADVYGGLRIAAAGQLGIGVGEEDWGSGEREVLEALIQNTDGLKDMLVSRYGDAPAPSHRVESQRSPQSAKRRTPWIGSFAYPEGSDGMVFTGCGSLSKESIRDIGEWMDDVFTFGDNAYGVAQSRPARRKARQTDNPAKTHTAEGSQPTQPEKRPSQAKAASDASTAPKTASEPNIPRPIVSAAQAALEATVTSADARGSAVKPDASSSAESATWRKYALLGYGYSWGASPKAPESGAVENDDKDASDRGGKDVESRSRKVVRSPNEDEGHYLIGLKGALRSLDRMDTPAQDLESDEAMEDDWSGRLSLRTLYVSMNDMDKKADSGSVTTTSQSDAFTVEEESKRERVRVVIYVHRPFVYVLLFDPSAPALSLPSYFSTLHRLLLPLHPPLLASTAPENNLKRIHSSLQASNTLASSTRMPTGVYSLLHEPLDITTITTIPNIPMPEAPLDMDAVDQSEQARTPLSRIEALNVHLQILSNYADTRHLNGGVGTIDRERTSKTNRGFWVVWLRVAKIFHRPADFDRSRPVTPAERSSQGSTEFTERAPAIAAYAQYAKMYREVLLVRRAGDAATRSAKHRQSSGPSSFTSSYGIARLLGRGGEGSGSPSNASPSTKKIIDGVGAGIGIDTRKFADALIQVLGS